MQLEPDRELSEKGKKTIGCPSRAGVRIVVRHRPSRVRDMYRGTEQRQRRRKTEEDAPHPSENKSRDRNEKKREPREKIAMERREEI